jgi:DNA-binding winged helix-turn-helix (wHTH) protein
VLTVSVTELRQALADDSRDPGYIATAHRRGYRFELRAAISLARLWRSHGQRQQAHELLADTYRWFTEGHTTATTSERPPYF